MQWPGQKMDKILLQNSDMPLTVCSKYPFFMKLNFSKSKEKKNILFLSKKNIMKVNISFTGPKI